jgi:hypothetical protein
MRPRSILVFEGLMFGTLALGWLHVALTWTGQTLRLIPITRQPLVFLVATMTITTTLFAVLTLLVSRRRSRVAAAMLIILFAFGIPTFVRTFTQGSPTGYTLLTAIQIIGHLVAYILLFLPSSRAWFRRDDAKPDLDATFS